MILWWPAWGSAQSVQAENTCCHTPQLRITSWTRSGLKLDNRELAPRSAWTNGVSNLAGPKFWLTGIAFLPTYLILNILTVQYQFHVLGITLWSPDNGLSVLLLIEGAEFAPFVLDRRGPR